MSAQQPSTKTSESSSVLDTQVLKRWLLLSRVGWAVLVVLTLAIFFSSLPVYIGLLQTPCVGQACGYQQLSPEQAATLEGIGLFPGVFIVFSVALTFILLVVCLVVSMVIVWRRPEDRMAFIVAIFLVTLSPSNVMFNVSASPSPWQVPNECLSFLFVTLLPLILALFPGGHFVPRWMRWPVIAFLVVQAPFTFFQAFASLQISAVSIGYVVNIGMCAILVVIQWYRYRRVSSPLERQQTKWVVFGFAAFVTWAAIGIVPYLLFPGVASPDSLYFPAFSAIQAIMILFIPLSFGFAMLRSRLWEIDIIINRTLVFGTLTVILTAVYVGLILGLQTLLRVSSVRTTVWLSSSLRWLFRCSSSPYASVSSESLTGAFTAANTMLPRSWQLSVRHYVMKWTCISSGSSCWASLKRRCSHRMFRCGYVLLNYPGNSKRGCRQASMRKRE